MKIFSFALIPLSKTIVGQTCSCDFCLREMDVGRGLRETDPGNWLPHEGLDQLADLLQYDSAFELPGSPSETALHAVLAAADERSSLGQLDVSAGVGAGLAIGLIVATALALVCYQQNITLFEADAFGTTLCLLLVCTCIGVVLGPLVYAVILRRTKPRRLLERVVREYRADPRQIQQLAAGYSRRTQAAANSLS